MHLRPSTIFPQPTRVPIFTCKVPTLLIAWPCLARLRLNAEVCGGVKKLTSQSNPQLMGDGRQSSVTWWENYGYILCSFSEILKNRLFIDFSTFPVLLSPLSTHVHSRIIFQVNYLHPRICLRFFEQPELGLALSPAFFGPSLIGK